MKSTNRQKTIIRQKNLRVVLSVIFLTGTLTGCSRLKYDMPYTADTEVSSFNVTAGHKGAVTEPFAADLCVVSAEEINADDINISQAEAAVLFDLNKRETLFSKNAHEKMHPASLTKILTALVALKNGTPDQMLTATDAVTINERGAQLCGLKSGDKMTLDQALHILLLYSANDVANLIAENVGGSVENFVAMMNEEAKRLGATNTNFANPHGLTDENHYTTPYDLYLIFNEAVKYEKFNEIIQMTSYQTTYYDGRGREKTIDISTTNRYLKGDFNPPSNVNVIGGKTGTTNAAGHCLMLLSRDAGGAPYISVIMRAEDSDSLYRQMTELLNEINNKL